MTSNGDMAERLQSVGVHVMSQEYCAAKTAENSFEPPTTGFCAGNALDEDEDGLIDGGADVCNGKDDLSIISNLYFQGISEHLSFVPLTEKQLWSVLRRDMAAG